MSFNLLTKKIGIVICSMSLVSFLSLGAEATKADTKGVLSFFGLSSEKAQPVVISDDISKGYNQQCHYPKDIKADRIRAEKIKTEFLKTDEINTEHLSAGSIEADNEQLCKLCAEKIFTECLFAKVAKIKDVCIRNAKIEEIWNRVIRSCSACIKKAKIEKLKSEYIKTCKLFTKDACIEDLWSECIHAKKIEHCTPYKAHVAITTPFIGYNFGADMKYDTVVSDPHHDVTNTGTYTYYTVPKTGWYTLSFSSDTCNVRDGGVINGTPILHPFILVNGKHAVHADYAFLSFNSNQNSLITSLLQLNEGDVVTTAVDLFVMDPSTGIMDYVGVADFNNPIPLFPEHPPLTYFMIHYLSSDCCPCCPHHDDDGCFSDINFGHCPIICPDSEGCGENCNNDEHCDHNEHGDHNDHGNSNCDDDDDDFDCHDHGHRGVSPISTPKPVGFNYDWDFSSDF